MVPSAASWCICGGEDGVGVLKIELTCFPSLRVPLQPGMSKEVTAIDMQRRGPCRVGFVTE